MGFYELAFWKFPANFYRWLFLVDLRNSDRSAGLEQISGHFPESMISSMFLVIEIKMVIA